MSKKTNHIVKESNALARAEILPAPESVWEERLIAQVAAFNRVDSPEFSENVLTIGELLNKKPSGTQLRQVEKAVQNLAGARFKVKERAEKFTVYPIFAFVKYEDGVISAQLNQKLKPHYLQLKQQFAIRSLPEFNSLSSIHSQRLYRYLNSWRNSPTGDLETSIEDLYTLVDASQTCRKDFRQFRLRILEVASTEINEKAGLRFEWEPIRPGKRKVTGIRFIFDEGRKAREVQAEPGAKKTADKLAERVAKECYLNTFNGLKRLCAPKKSGKNAKYCKLCQKSGLYAARWLRKTPGEQAEFLRRAPAMTQAEQTERIKIAYDVVMQKKTASHAPRSG